MLQYDDMHTIATAVRMETLVLQKLLNAIRGLFGRKSSGQANNPPPRRR